MVLPALAGLLALLLSVLGQGIDHIRATDAARSAARLIARGDDLPEVRRAALQEAPAGASVATDRADGLVTVTVSAPGRMLLPGLRLPQVRASASVVEEQPTSWSWP